MSLLSRLFGSTPTPKPEAEPEVYKDFRIFAEPVKEGGTFRVAARIEREIDGELKTHLMVRADTCNSAEMAEEVSTRKAKTLIDQTGNALFD